MIHFTTTRRDLLQMGMVDIRAAFTQSGRIACKEGFPSVADRMYEAAEEVEQGTKLIIVGGEVELDPNDPDAVIVTVRDNLAIGRTRVTTYAIVRRVEVVERLLEADDFG